MKTKTTTTLLRILAAFPLLAVLILLAATMFVFYEVCAIPLRQHRTYYSDNLVLHQDAIAKTQGNIIRYLNESDQHNF